MTLIEINPLEELDRRVPFSSYYYSEDPPLRMLRDYYCRLCNFYPVGPYKLLWVVGEINGLVFAQNGIIIHSHLDRAWEQFQIGRKI